MGELNMCDMSGVMRFLNKSKLAATICLMLSSILATCSVQANPVAPPASKGEKTVNATILHQTTDALGRVDLYLTETAGRLVARNGDLTVTSSAPSWDILLYSASKNKGWRVPGSQTHDGHFNLLDCPIELAGAKPKQVHDPNLNVDYVLLAAKAKVDPTKSTDVFIFQSKENRVYSRGHMKLAINLLKISPQLQNFLYWVYSEHLTVGVPLECKGYFQDGGVRSKYTTQSIEKKSVPASVFEYQKNYKKVAEKMNVLLSDDMKSTMEDLWGSKK